MSSREKDRGNRFVLHDIDYIEAKGMWVRLPNVIHMGYIGPELLSMSALDDHNIHAPFRRGEVFLYDDNNKKTSWKMASRRRLNFSTTSFCC